MPYLFELADRFGESLSELPGATQRRVALPLKSIGTSGVTVRADHDMADAIMECDTRLRVWDVPDDWNPGDPSTGDRVLLAHHRQVTAEEVGSPEGVTVAATFADAFWNAYRRLIGKESGGAFFPQLASEGTVTRVQAIDGILSRMNQERSTGLMDDPTPYVEVGPQERYGPYHYRKGGEVMAEIAATLGGPDWIVDAIEVPQAHHSVPAFGDGYFGILRLADVIGGLKEDAAFEFGDGLLNVRSYRRTVTLDGSANRVYSLPPGYPTQDGSGVLMREDAAAQSQHGLLEDVVSSDLTVDELRGSLLDAHLAVRKLPRQTITFDPMRDTHGAVPRLGRDFEVGDVVPHRASIVREGELTKRLDVLVRVHQWALQLDDMGAGAVTLTTTPS